MKRTNTITYAKKMNKNNKNKNNKNKNKTTRKTRTSNQKSKIVVFFLEMLNMIKLYHWKTRSYPQHKATDELYEKLSENIDRFVEVLLGKDQSRLTLLEKKKNLSEGNGKDAFQDRLLENRAFLIGFDRYFDEDKDRDLLNIRDEILADVNQFLYLMSFK
jgi:hypothetical protein